MTMRWMMGLAALVGAASADARDLDVPIEKGWQHARSGLILRARIAEFVRTGISDSTADELDVAAQFRSTQDGTILTIFVFRPASGGVALWFDRARTALEQNKAFGSVSPLTSESAFALPGRTTASAMRQAFTASSAAYRGTAVAIVPIGEWLVALRVSGPAEGASIDARLTAVLAAISWPASTDAAATSIEPCPEPLRFAKAKQRKPDMMQGLMAGALASALAEEAAKTKGEPAEAPLCRDATPPTSVFGVYRHTGQEGYMLALGDAGRTVAVSPSLTSLLVDSKPGYAVSFNDLDGSTSHFPEFDRLPRPEQVVDTVMRGTPVSRTSDGGKNITINAK
jgi:hypothetical protein